MTDELPEPYQGLRPYLEQDKDRFFGRDGECKIFIDKILANKLTLLFAASGVGKSSLLQAAILPRLKDPRQENLDAVYYNDWVTPPLSGLPAALQAYLEEKQYIAAGTPIEAGGLKDCLEFSALLTRQPLILILDQFEEFFRYQRGPSSYEDFIRQLAGAIGDRNLPVNVVLSMREDFALELIEFKPYLPTLLFDNYFRLERLSKDNARLALVAPLQTLGFRFQDGLLDTLLTDLSTRELAQGSQPVAEMKDTVEPAYLQIICSQLWEQDKTNPDNELRLASYTAKGKAKGILESYVASIMQDFGFGEQSLASAAFNHLVTQRGVKMAYTAAGLAKTLDVKDAENLTKVLNKLEQSRILRSQSRQNEQWFELYHDMFAKPIEDWNDGFKTKARKRKALIAFVAALISLGVSYILYDGVSNYLSYYLKLSVNPEISNSVELYQGKEGSWDFFRQQHYEAETGFLRTQLEPDKVFTSRLVTTYGDENTELIGSIPFEDRITAYWEDGQQEKALELVEQSLLDVDSKRKEATIRAMGQFRSDKAIDVLQEQLKKTPYLNETIIEILSEGPLAGPKAVKPLAGLLGNDEKPGSTSLIQALVKLDRSAVQPLIDLLNDTGNRKMREDAAQALGELGWPEAVPSLYESINKVNHGDNDGDNSFIDTAINALVEIGTPSRQYLIELIHNSNAYVRSNAAEALGKLGQGDAIPALIERLENDTDESVRRSMALALCKFKSPQAVSVPSFIPMLKDADSVVRFQVSIALGRLGHTEAIPTLIDLLKTRNFAYGENELNEIEETLVKLGQPSVKPLIDLLKIPRDNVFPKPNVRIWAANVLGKIGQPAAISPLIELFKMESVSFVRQRLVDAVADHGQSAVQPLIDVLKSNKRDRRIEVARALGETGLPEAISPLIDLLDKDADKDVRDSAARALVKLAEPAVKPLSGLLISPKSNVRIEAAWALGKIHKATNIPIPDLIKLLKDNDKDVRRVAAEALGEIDQTAFKPLTKLLTDDDKDVRRAAVVSLGELGQIEAVPNLVELLMKDADPYVRISAADALGKLGQQEAVQPLITALNDKNEYLRISAIRALGEIGGPQAISALIDSLDKDEGSSVLSEASDALVKIGAPAVQKLIELLKTDNMDVRIKSMQALAEIGQPEAVLNIIDQLKSDDDTILEHAATALGMLGQPEVVPALIGLLNNPNYSVQSSAVKALGKLAQSEAVPALIGCIKDEDCGVANDAAEALVIINYPNNSLQLLKDESDSRDENQKLEETIKLDSVIAQLSSSDINIKIRAIQTITKLRPRPSDAVTQINTLLHDPNIRVQRAVLYSLYQLDTKALQVALVNLLNHYKDQSTLYIYELLGNFQVKAALPELEHQLRKLEQDYRQWRGIRDEVRDDFTDQDLKDWKTRLGPAKPKIFLSFPLGYALARVDPEGWGVKLLGHDLAKVREGAWMGLGQAADVALLNRLYKDWLATDNPIFRHAAYRAIDNILIRLEGYGKPEEIEQLRAFQKLVSREVAETEKQNQHLKPKPYDPRDSVLTRADWTLMKWEWLQEKKQREAEAPSKQE